MRTDSLTNEVAFLMENPDVIAQYVAALERVRRFQPERMAWFRSQGVVFDKAPGPVADVTPDHRDYWQHVAFAIYTDLCEIESIASGVLRD